MSVNGPRSTPSQPYVSAEYNPGPSEGVVVDLSEFAERLVNYEDISAELSEEQERRLVDYVKSMVDMSYFKIRKRYDHWKEADRAHDVYVPADTTDFREKAVIADTRAIADTVLTYMMAALGGRNPMFQLEGLNRKSRKSSLILERVLHQQMRRTAGEARLAQLLLDSIRYGFAPTKVVWDAKTNQNQLINFDPRRCFPDPRVNWGDWDNMQYIVFADYVSYNSLLYSGLYPKLKKFPHLRHKISPPRNSWNAHHWHKEEGRGLSIDPAQPNQRERFDHAYFTLGDARVIDEAWVRLSGHEIGIPSIEQIFLVVTILDENVVIRCQLNPYGRQFPVVIGGLYQDSHKTYGQSLYDLILPMHDIATYLLRSRIDNVTAALNNLIFADPTQVSIPDLIDRNPWGIVHTPRFQTRRRRLYRSSTRRHPWPLQRHRRNVRTQATRQRRFGRTTRHANCRRHSYRNRNPTPHPTWLPTPWRSLPRYVVHHHPSDGAHDGRQHPRQPFHVWLHPHRQ